MHIGNAVQAWCRAHDVVTKGRVAVGASTVCIVLSLVDHDAHSLRLMSAWLGGLLLFATFAPKATGSAHRGGFALVCLLSIVCGLLLPAWAGPVTIALTCLCASKWGAFELRGAASVLGVFVPVWALVHELIARGLVIDLVQQGEWGISRAITGITGTPELLGSSYLPFGAISITAGLWLAGVLLGRPSYKEIICSGLVLLLGIAWALLAKQEWVAYLTAGLAFVLPATGYSPAHRAPAVRHAALAAASLVAAALVCLGYSNGFASSPARPKHMVFMTGGAASFYPRPYPALRTFDSLPDFSALPRLFKAHGWRVTYEPQAIEPAGLEDATVLVCINPSSAFDEATLDRIRQWVEAGGHLIVLGDHTDIGGLQAPVNQLVAGTGMTLAYDSVVPAGSGTWAWAGKLRSCDTRGYRGRTAEEIGISVGASVEVAANAMPLVLATEAFGDAGDPERGVSHLGNMSYDPGEPSGDLIVCGRSPMGRGDITLWGDTAGFQTSSLLFTEPFIVEHVEALRRHTLAMPKRAAYLLAAGLGIAGIMICRRWPLGWTLALLPFLAMGIGDRLAFPAGRNDKAPDFRNNIVLDRSHGSRYPDGREGTSVHALAELCSRLRWPLRTGDDIISECAAKPRGIVLVAPTKPYGPAEVEELRRYVQSGGHLLVLGGFEQRASLASLGNAFGVEYEEVCLGPVHNARVTVAGIVPSSSDEAQAANSQDEAAYDSVMPFKCAYGLRSSSLQPLVTCWGHNAAVGGTAGSGFVAFIGDARFANDENLAVGAERYLNVPPSRFIAHCLGDKR